MDKINNSSTLAPEFFSMEATLPNYGWCDSPLDPMYNQFVHLPYHESHENLWLTDSNAYDLFAVIGYNDDPVVPYKGSAIFFHVTETYAGTAGCVAMSLQDIEWVLSRIDAGTHIVIS